jgi:micrococcal nuclease
VRGGARNPGRHSSGANHAHILSYYFDMNRHIILFLLFASPACAAEYPARVVGIAVGDTLTVLAAGRTQLKIRLSGIDAPESGQDFGTRAKQAASSMAFGKTVTLIERDTDRYGRTVAEIILPDGRSMNREMVGQGMAWWYRKYAPGDKVLAQLEAEARRQRRGLWNQSAPMPPWNWRMNPQTTAGVVANRRSHLYHLSSCSTSARVKVENRVSFGTAAAAEAAGYRKAGDCQSSPAR